MNGKRNDDWSNKLKVMKTFMDTKLKEVLKYIEKRDDFNEIKETMRKCIKEEIARQKKSNIDDHPSNRNIMKFNGSTKEVKEIEHDEIGKEDKNEPQWSSEPKHWAKYNRIRWDEEVIKDRNKAKGCLHKCGKNNTK